MNLEDKVLVTGYINDFTPCYYVSNTGVLEAISPQKALDLLPFFSIFNTERRLETNKIRGITSIIFRE